jgi:hypothetical protein
MGKGQAPKIGEEPKKDAGKSKKEEEPEGMFLLPLIVLDNKSLSSTSGTKETPCCGWWARGRCGQDCHPAQPPLLGYCLSAASVH